MCLEVVLVGGGGALALVGFLLSCNAFVIQLKPTVTTSTTQRRQIPLYNFLGDKERDALTRDSEPEEFFATNTDKMTDEEKIPIAIAGVAFITIPFIAGLIALYAAKY
ncbi:hypothetical protein ACA910_001741 [Epithemia clementina (nom. ined.)]